MNSYSTVFASVGAYEKGHIEIVDGKDKPMHYCFSNMFEVADKSGPYEKVAVAKNERNLIEAIRAEGDSPWYAASHDEFVIAMDGEVEVHFVKLAAEDRVSKDKEGNVTLPGEPKGQKMGWLVLRRGHQAILPADAAYQFRARRQSVLMQQSLEGDNTIYRWKDSCLS